MKNKKLKRRFSIIILVFAVFILGMWIIFQNTVFSYYKQNANEIITMAENSLLMELDDEFSRIRAVASGIAGSSSVQDFLAEKDTTVYYNKAGLVSEIIRRATYPHMDADIIITVTADGIPHRFVGSLSNDAIEKIYREAAGIDALVYFIMDLEGTDFLCFVEPVYSRNTQIAAPVGYVVAISNAAKIRNTLMTLSTVSGIDTAVILDDLILLSSNPELDGQMVDELHRLYSAVTVERVTGSRLFAATAITKEAYYYGERLFYGISAITVIVLLATLFLLYRILSSKMVKPMLETSDNMKMGLLMAQIDAHFIVNTINCIESLSQQNENEKAAIASGNLAKMLKSQFTAGEEANVFEVIQNLNSYIEIMNIRNDDKFITQVDINDVLVEYSMPVQVLQPLVENALTHGLGNKKEDCRLTVTGKIENSGIIFEVSDNGKGMEADAIRELQKNIDAADGWEDSDYNLKGVALGNIQKRIRARYGKKYGLTVRGAPAEGMTFTVRLPLIPYKE